MLPLIYCLPLTVFLLLQVGELCWPGHQSAKPYKAADWALNILGLFIQGVLIPIAGILLAKWIFPSIPFLVKGTIPLSWWGSFLLNFVVIDFLYYWQHRLFHRQPTLWKMHECHHRSPRVDIWATSRNNLFVNFLFVYLLVNPMLGYLCVNPEGFFAGAMLTASLDILRHSKMDFSKIRESRLVKMLSAIFVMPWMHHSHHNVLLTPHNFGANLIIWDKLFKTYQVSHSMDVQWQPIEPLSYRQQFYYPIIR